MPNHSPIIGAASGSVSAAQTSTAASSRRASSRLRSAAVAVAAVVVAAVARPAASTGAAASGGALKVASYPAFLTAAISASAPAAALLRLTLAVSVARFTDTLATPGTFASAFSTRSAQDAQVIPPIASSVVRGASAGAASAWTDGVAS